MEHGIFPHPRTRTAIGAFELMAITRSGISPRLLAHVLARGQERAEAPASVAASTTNPVVSLSR